MVVEGATLTCTFGSARNKLQIPNVRGVYSGEKKRANTADCIGGANILSFGTCNHEQTEMPCQMAITDKWLNGNGSIIIDGEMALSKSSICICDFGGIISIVKDGR